jgi:hypothetical protein
MQSFTYYNPTKIIFGRRTIGHIGREIDDQDIKKVLLLAGGGSIKQNGVYKSVSKSLKRAGIEWTEVWDVRPNPSLSHALEAIDNARSFGAQAILAVGGGSVIDEAKSIAAGYYLDDLWAAFAGDVEIKQALPVYTVLTISGTSSECDPLAVLTRDEAREKWSIGSPLLYPKTSIIDPSVQATLPWRQTINGAIDAMSHIMEYYFTGSGEIATLYIDEVMIGQIIQSTDQLRKDESDYQARANLAWCASLALGGMAAPGIGRGDWAVHAIEHSLSAFHPEIAHGEGLAVLYPAWIIYCREKNPDQFERWAKHIWKRKTVESAVETMKARFREWGAPVLLRELGIDEEELPELAGNAVLKGDVGWSFSLNKDDVYNILKIAY